MFKCDKDVILIPFIVYSHYDEIMSNAHTNLIVIRQNTVEWFESHGRAYLGDITPEENEKIMTSSNSFLQQFVEKLNKHARINSRYKNITPRKYKLLTPDFLCPNFGPQGNDKLCMTWILYVLIQIIRNPEEDTKQIIDDMIKVDLENDYNLLLLLKTFIMNLQILATTITFLKVWKILILNYQNKN